MPKKVLIFVENMFFNLYTDYYFDEIRDRLTFRHNVLLFEQSKLLGLRAEPQCVQSACFVVVDLCQY